MNETIEKFKEKLQEYFAILALSLLGGLFIAYSFAVTVDGRIKFDILTLPAVFPIATMFGIAGGALISPLAFICLRNKNLFVAVPTIVMLVAVLTACLNLATAPKQGLPGSLILSFIVLLLWRQFGPEKRSKIASNHFSAST